MNRLCFYFCMVLLVLFIVDCGGGTTRTLPATVVDRTYVPAHTSYSTDSKGRFQTHYTPDDYTIVVRGWDGITKVDTNAEGYYSVKQGQQITYTGREGCISHHLWLPSYRQ